MKNYIIVAIIIILIIIGVVWYTSKSSTEVVTPTTIENTVNTDGSVAPAPAPEATPATDASVTPTAQ